MLSVGSIMLSRPVGRLKEIWLIHGLREGGDGKYEAISQLVFFNRLNLQRMRATRGSKCARKRADGYGSGIAPIRSTAERRISRIGADSRFGGKLLRHGTTGRQVQSGNRVQNQP